MTILAISADWIPVSVTDDATPYGNANGGYARYTPTTVKALSDAPVAGTTLPAIARHAIINVRSNPIRYKVDGNSPTASEGQFLAAGTDLVIENQPRTLKQFKFIDAAAGASEVTITYFY